ncbi:hypothetical protein [uncultured Ruegeria sp.]|uniref:hypothetical protein n=1 Tax=uncultured Ruegeria sp. TaxID=259304 RepID=UPI002621352E|nr:hypothetical protein [uncultured Ruegeria sp.]
MWEKAGIDLALPSVTGVQYILEWMGPDGLNWYKSMGMGGIEPIDWREIDAFSGAAGLDLEPWEARQLRLMSVAYVSGYARGMRPMVVSPAYQDRPDDDLGLALERKKISDQIKAGFGGS